MFVVADQNLRFRIPFLCNNARPQLRYRRFEDLPVWKTAIELAVGVYALTANPQFRPRWSLRDQLERSSVSVSNNIAEGFERGTNNELVAFLYISRGSAGEARSMFCLLNRLDDFRELEDEIDSLRAKAESCSRQLKAWIQSIQDSDFRGERHVSVKSKRRDQEAREREEFLLELAEMRAKGRQTQKEPAEQLPSEK